MELIGKQIAIETILGQPPELHYPSWYAAQIEKLPPAPPEYLAEQAGILVTDDDTISRQAVLDALNNIEIPRNASWYQYYQQALTAVGKLQPAQPERIKARWIRTGSGSLYDHYQCTRCGKAPKWELMGDNNWHIAFTDFCPNCGAKMEVTE